MTEEQQIQRRTNQIAKKLGCDRGFCSVCSGKVEEGLPCRCEDDARAEFAKRAAA